MSKSDKDRKARGPAGCLMEVLGEKWVTFEESSDDELSDMSDLQLDTDQAEPSTKATSSILAAGCGSCDCCTKIAAALRAGEKHVNSERTLSPSTPLVQEIPQSIKNTTMANSNSIVSATDNQILAVFEAEGAPSAKVKPKRRKRRVLLSLPSARKKVSKNKSSTPKKITLQSVSSLANQVIMPQAKEKATSSSENVNVTATSTNKKDEEKPPSHNIRAGNNAAASKSKNNADEETLPHENNVVKKSAVKRQKKRPKKLKVTNGDFLDTPSQNSNRLKERSFDSNSRNEPKRNFGKKHTLANPGSRYKMLSSDSEDEYSRDGEDVDYRRKSARTDAKGKVRTSPRKLKNISYNSDLIIPDKICTPSNDRHRPNHIVAHIDNKVFKISMHAENGKIPNTLTRKLARRGGSSLNSSYVGKNIILKPSNKRQTLYSDDAWRSSQLFQSMCAQSE